MIDRSAKAREAKRTIELPCGEVRRWRVA